MKESSRKFPMITASYNKSHKVTKVTAKNCNPKENTNILTARYRNLHQRLQPPMFEEE